MRNRLDVRREGFALGLTIIVIAGLAVLASGALMVGMNSTLVRHYSIRQDELTHAADAGLELARARLNGDPSLYPDPDSGYAILELDSVVRGPGGVPVPNTTRSTYAGPIGITSGQYGVHGAVVSVVRSGPNVLVRRGGVVQESFSRFAYFTDDEGVIVFGGGDFLLGPVHSNDNITIHSTGATFDGEVTTARSVISAGNGTFREGFTENAPAIPLPALADLQKLRTQAESGGLSFTTTSGNATGRARMRIEFVAIDLNGDGDATDENEGFIRVYQGNTTDWVVGANPTGNLRNSRNCGHHHFGGEFRSAFSHGTSGADNWLASVTNNGRICYLGGAPEITDGWQASDAFGSWDTWGGTVSPLLSLRDDRNHLFPLSRSLNPGYKGVIYVDGDVAVSGTVRSRVTVATTGNIVIADDLVYSIDPAVGNCHDILGLFAGGSVVVAETPINSAWQRGSGSAWFSYDDSTEERVHAFVLTLNSFIAEDHDQGPTNAEDCEGTNWGRGCLYLTGGIIQRIRGAVGLSSGTGYLKRYSYDQCGESQPPPYFPTTGRFSRGAYYEVDPTGFNIDAYFALMTAGS